MPKLIRALHRAFERGVEAPPRHMHELAGDASMLLMPSWYAGGNAGLKIVTVHRSASPSWQATYLLIDGRTGKTMAVIDGTMLTLRRTAAASALAADRLAHPDARCLLMLGTGALIPHLVEAHRSVRAIDRVCIWGRHLDKAHSIAASIRGAGIEAVAVADRALALGRADIISSATSSLEALVQGNLLKTGAHVDLVGAFRPDMCEADPECFSRARVFVDTREGAAGEAGDLLQAIAAGVLTFSDIEAELSELCSGLHRGRGEDLDAITLFKSVGTAVEDLAAAELVFGSLKNEQE